VKQRITAWLGSWRTARFAVDSPLDIDDAGRQLAAGLASRRTTVVYAYEHGLGVLPKAAIVMAGMISRPSSVLGASRSLSGLDQGTS
jgi:hypothetical protein